LVLFVWNAVPLALGTPLGDVSIVVEYLLTAPAFAVHVPLVTVKLPKYKVAVMVPSSVPPSVVRTIRSFGSQRCCVALVTVPITVTVSLAPGAAHVTVAAAFVFGPLPP
jgi:hypothetical protein